MSMISKQDLVTVAAFRRSLRRLLKFVEDLARLEGITPQQHQLLLATAAHPDRDWATVGELAEALQLKHHAAVGLVDRCQAVGLVSRSQDPQDKRVVRVNLTEKGDEILRRITEQNLHNLKHIGLLAYELQVLGVEGEPSPTDRDRSNGFLPASARR